MTRIHINQHIVKRNKQLGRNDPAVTVKQGGRNRYCEGVTWDGPSRLVPQFDRPLACGATVWIETEAELTLIGETTFAGVGAAVYEAIVQAVREAVVA